MKTIAIIPARGGSKRLQHKNIYPVFGKPMIAYTIEALKACDFVDAIFVSSDDDAILQVAAYFGAIPIKRPEHLADDQTPKIEAIRQAVTDPAVQAENPIDTIIVAQANSPELDIFALTRGYELLNRHSLWEVMSADESGVQNAAFRMVRLHALGNTFLSAHCGFVVANIRDIHTLEDVHALEADPEFKARHQPE
jgi:CMP-N-acetylneuraminic acid synthetase